jgi:hypothetical protein
MSRWRWTFLACIVALDACALSKADRDAGDSVTRAAPGTSEKTDTAAASVASARPELWPAVYPHVYEGACEGESCVATFDGLACRDVRLRTSPHDTSGTALMVRKGDTVGVRQDLHLMAPGIVLIRADFTRDSAPDESDNQGPATDTLRFKAGDTLFLLAYEQLGHWLGAWHGRVVRVTEFWRGLDDGSVGSGWPRRDSAIGVALSHPRTVRWWRVTLRSNRVGWWRYADSDSLLSMHMIQQWGDKCSE